MGVYHFVSRTETRDEIATMYNILIIYSSKKDTLESVENKNYGKHNHTLTLTGLKYVYINRGDQILTLRAVIFTMRCILISAHIAL